MSENCLLRSAKSARSVMVPAGAAGQVDADVEVEVLG